MWTVTCTDISGHKQAVLTTDDESLASKTAASYAMDRCYKSVVVTSDDVKTPEG
jgi:hypothetical protein